jgi:hypothetical protein
MERREYPGCPEKAVKPQDADFTRGFRRQKGRQHDVRLSSGRLIVAALVRVGELMNNDVFNAGKWLFDEPCT